MFIFKFIFYFAISFFILCIPVGEDKLLFNSLYSFVSPHADKLLDETKDKLNKTAYYSKKLYSNSEPDFNTDKVSKKMAGIKKGAQDIVIGFKEEVIDEDGYVHEDDEEYRMRQILNED